MLDLLKVYNYLKLWQKYYLKFSCLTRESESFRKSLEFSSMTGTTPYFTRSEEEFKSLQSLWFQILIFHLKQEIWENSFNLAYNIHITYIIHIITYVRICNIMYVICSWHKQQFQSILLNRGYKKYVDIIDKFFTIKVSVK